VIDFTGMSQQRINIIETLDHVGEEVLLKGWVHVRRNMGKLIFIDLRDRSGIAQVVFHSGNKEALEKADVLKPEYCVAIRGKVNARPEKQVNPDLPTGAVEIEGLDLEVLNESKTPPFEVDKDTREVNEETRMKYRYLDLRSERMTKNLILRDRVAKGFRDFLHRNGFIEIETPYLTKGTPEGSREYLVPARLHPGKFYVLPQSPQQFKQLMMVGGVERYFQMARCFRDEDNRGDRQPEHTQFDLEMSFVEREDVMSLVEEMMIEIVKTTSPQKKIQQIPFPRFSYEEVMKKYGTDKPDLREDKNNPDLLAFSWVVDFPFFEEVEGGGWTFSHNPFSAPKPEHMEMLMEKRDIGSILTTQYDIVLNGYEVGGGSIRNHRPEALRKVFEILGHSEEDIEEKFGHMIEAFSYGAPPHGGLGPGLDRLVMILANEPNIREVIAIPKTGDARDPLMGAPSALPETMLQEAHILPILKKKE